MKKFLIRTGLVLVLLVTAYVTFIYYFTYSEGYRSGQLVKISYKGFIFKTWEGQLSQGVSDAQLFKFSIEEDEERIIQLLKDYQGTNVRLKFKERYRTFSWLGDTRYFITDVEKVDTLDPSLFEE